MAYAESESMAIKRLKVALKRKDWQMFEYGLSRTIDLLSSGTNITEIQEWYKILDNAKAENAPEEPLKKLASIIESILTPGSAPSAPSDSSTKSSDTIKFTQPKISAPMSIVKAPDIPFVIFLNGYINEEQTKIVEKLRYKMLQMSVEPEIKIEPDFLSGLSTLIAELDGSNQELNGLEELLNKYPKPGIIITTGYDSEIIKILKKNEINYSIEGVKKPSSDKHWKVYPLAGMSSIFWCPACNSKSFYHNFSQTVIATCKKCSAPAYPDLHLINTSHTQVNPKLWYMTYKILVNSANWLLISPPDASDNKPVSQLLLEACDKAVIENAFIVSNKSEIGTWWRNKLEETNSNANVAPVCFNVEILYNNYIKIPEKETANITES